jgi:hypothetical protein
MRIIVTIFVCFSLFISCSSQRKAAYHIGEANKHLNKARRLDPSVTLSDTTVTWEDMLVKLKEVKGDTTVDLTEDTVTFKVDDITVKSVINKKANKQSISVHQPPKDTIVKAPVKTITNDNIQKEMIPWYVKPVAIVASGFVGLVLLLALLRRLGIL